MRSCLFTADGYHFGQVTDNAIFLSATVNRNVKSYFPSMLIHFYYSKPDQTAVGLL